MRLAKSKNGVAAVEFAIVLPLLVILVFGIIEFGLALYDKAVITNASREGARAGIVAVNPRLSIGEITSIVNNYCGSYLITFGGGTLPTVAVTGAGGAFGSDLTVTVTYNYNFLVLPNFTSLTGPITIAATTVMRME